jgi:hypothetical protein
MMEQIIEVETEHFGKVSLKVEQFISENPGVDGYFLITEKPKELSMVSCFFDSVEDVIEKVMEYDQNFSFVA